MEISLSTSACSISASNDTSDKEPEKELGDGDSEGEGEEAGASDKESEYLERGRGMNEAMEKPDIPDVTLIMPKADEVLSPSSPRGNYPNSATAFMAPATQQGPRESPVELYTPEAECAPIDDDLITDYCQHVDSTPMHTSLGSDSPPVAADMYSEAGLNIAQSDGAFSDHRRASYDLFHVSRDRQIFEKLGGRSAVERSSPLSIVGHANSSSGMRQNPDATLNDGSHAHFLSLLPGNGGNNALSNGEEGYMGKLGIFATRKTWRVPLRAH